VDRRAFLATLSGSLLAAPLAAEAQQPGKVFRIRILGNVPPTDPEGARVWGAFIEGLRDLGYAEGQNITIVHRSSEGKFQRLPDLAAELVRLKVDVIVAPASQNVLAAKQASRTIPIVMAGSGDPVGTGFIASLARPGGNVTGSSYFVGLDIYSKQLELLKETVPKVRRVAILSNPTNPAHPLWMREIKGAGRSLGVQLQFLEARGPTEFDGAFAAMAKERAGALLVVADGMFMLHRTRLADLAAKSRLPSLGYRELVEAGGLMSYGPSLPDLWRRAAIFVDRILKGAKPADLPIEQPAEFELVINLKTAKALGLTIPPSLLQRADQVIE
jgi:putative ABC transport system substrate-binding protein